jgi:hypothetical protein
LRAPWSDAALDFDGDGRVELLVGVSDVDASTGHARWSMAIHETTHGRRLGALPDVVPEAVAYVGAHPAILAMRATEETPPAFGTISLHHWDGRAFTTAWTRDDSSVATISSRVDVVGDTAPAGPYAEHAAVADLERDGLPEVLLFARGTTTDGHDHAAQLLAASAADGHVLAAYDITPGDDVEVIGVEGLGDSLRVWIRSRRLGIVALDRHLALVRPRAR